MNAHFSNERILLPAKRRTEIFFLIMLRVMAASLWNVRAQPTLSSTNASSTPDLSLQASPESIWEDGVGEGFRSARRYFGHSAGATCGIAAFGSREGHDLGLAFPMDTCSATPRARTLGIEAIANFDWNCSQGRNFRPAVSGWWD